MKSTLDAVEKSAAAWDTRSWGYAALALLALLGAIVALFHETFAGVVGIWYRSETYAHGFLVVPVSLWLIWRERFRVQGISPRPDPRPLALIAALGFIWLIGAAGSVEVLQQLAVFGLLPVAVWLCLGWSVARVWWFPLVFVLLAVPFGDFLVPTLMDYTADATVSLLRLSGIPVYREGRFFSLPTGDWSVVEACSGIRYLIAAFTLGCVYAYLTYWRTLKRVAFIAASIVVPIVANWIRAYLIVLLGHLTNNRLAAGVDHIIYGWVFFGAVMLLLFVVGGFWRDADSPSDPESDTRRPAATGREAAQGHRYMIYAILGAMVAGVWPIYSVYAESAETDYAAASSDRSLNGLDGWQPVESFTHWRPQYQGHTSADTYHFADEHGPIGLYVAVYADQREGAELIAWENKLTSFGGGAADWRVVSEDRLSIELESGRAIPVVQSRLTNGRDYLDAWHTFNVAGRFANDALKVKWLTARERLLARPDAAAIIVAFTETRLGEKAQVRRAGAFLSDALPMVERDLLEGIVR